MRAEGPGAGTVLDLIPQMCQAGLGPFQLGQARVVGQNTPVLEVDQLEPGRCPTPQAPQDQGVEAHLEQRLLHEARARAAAGLIVDHAHGAVGRHIQAVDKAPQEQTITGLGLDEELALRGFQTLRVLQGEVGTNESTRFLQPGLHLSRILEQSHDLRTLLPMRLPLTGQQFESHLNAAFGDR